ncbi:hypothetical protein ACPEIF_28955 [Streptomyces sp. NPDC012600]|uniref:hypothetical protein n=1 Tax=unclassified Streptomyces TaxID=2593676 RepID=UPI00367A8A69
MYEGSIPLEDFLDTMNRLQADFERRLGGIESRTPPAPLVHAHTQERSSASAWAPEDGYRPLGIEAIWATARTSPDEGPNSPREHPSSHRWGAPAD